MQSVLSFHAPEEVSIVEWLSVTPNEAVEKVPEKTYGADMGLR